MVEQSDPQLWSEEGNRISASSEALRVRARLQEAIAKTNAIIDEASGTEQPATGLDIAVAAARSDLARVSNALMQGTQAEVNLVRMAHDAERDVLQIGARLTAWKQFSTEARVRGATKFARMLDRGVLLRIEPLSGIACNPDQASHPWLSTDNDPQFRIHGLGRFAGYWVELSFELDILGGSAAPVLYVDGGNGFSEATSFRVPPPSSDTRRSSILFVVPVSIRDVRLDPFEHAGSFLLRAVTARRVSRPAAAAKMLAAIRSAGRISDVLVAPARTNSTTPGLRARMVSTYKQVVFGNAYADWIARYELPRAQYSGLDRARTNWDRQPLISVVMPVYNTPAALLRAAINSVLAQTYPNWELCVANDASTQRSVFSILDSYAASDRRIKIVHRAKNGHISAASNSALELCSGEFVAFLDHDDRLHPLALHFVAESILDHPGAGIIYSDEDKVDERGRRFDPYFKCEFNAQLFLSHNMICHLGCYRRDLVESVGGFRSKFDGSQDYDLALRAVDLLDRSQIVHIPRVLYHWTAIAGSTALSSGEKPYAHTSAKRAIEEHFDRVGVVAEVSEAPESQCMNRVRYMLPANRPSVCVVIPTRDRADLLEVCTGSIARRTLYENYHICVVDNGSVEPDTLEFFQEARNSGIRVIRDESPFNFSALNNRAVRATDADYVVLMNNDIEVISPDWVEEMVGHAMQPGVGAVGARLWYPDGRLQHGGVILGIGGVAGHSHRALGRGQPSYFSRAVLQQEFSAVTAACLMIKRSTYEQVGGLDERLQVAFNDVDFCLRLVQRGYHNVWTPYAEFIHHESASRGAETTPAKQARFNAEAQFMEDRWGSTLRKDPAYSPNLTLETEDFALAWPPRVQPRAP